MLPYDAADHYADPLIRRVFKDTWEAQHAAVGEGPKQERGES
jgi:hypothetical protein